MSLFLTDDDIFFNSINIDKSTIEYDFYKQNLISILAFLSHSYMELRHYTEAQKCLNEALELTSEEKIQAILYFRLAQTRIYNRFSREESWAIALSDLNKAKRILETSSNFMSVEDKDLNEYIKVELENIQSLIYNYEQEKNFRNTSKKNLFVLTLT